MNRLVLAFGIVCLLQGLSAAPRPEYGLTVDVRNSGRIMAVVDDVYDLVGDLESIELVTLTAGYGNYETTLDVISSLIDDVGGVVTPILSAYEDLLDNTGGNVDAAFTPLLNAIADATSYLGGSDITGYLGVLSGLGYEGIVDQLSDEGERLLDGLDDLSTAAILVKTKLNAAFTAAGGANVPAATLNANLHLADMYAFLTAANNLKAFFPLLTYILYTVNEHLYEGDNYINSLQSAIDDNTGPATSDYLAELDEIITAIESDVSGGFESIYDAYSGIYASFEMMDLLSAADYSGLDDTISAFVAAFDFDVNIGAMDSSLSAAFAEIGTALSSLISDLTSSVTAVDNSLVQLLVDTLIGNLEYGDYCFHKYMDLVENLLTAGLDGGWECVDKEYLRLQHLQSTLMLMMELLQFDYEYMEAELSVCDSVAYDPANMSNCVTELNTYYSELLTMTEAKRDLIYDLAEAEAEASLNRLLICFELVFIDTSVTQVADITSGLTECAVNGPNGSD